MLSRAVITAVEIAVGLEIVANDATAAVGAIWREGVDRAFEGVEYVLVPVVQGDRERFVVVVSTYGASGHGVLRLDESLPGVRNARTAPQQSLSDEAGPAHVLPYDYNVR